MKEILRMSPDDMHLYRKLCAKHEVNAQRVSLLKELLKHSVDMSHIVIMCANRAVAFETMRAFKKSGLPCNVTRIIDEFGNFGVKVTKVPIQ